MTGLEGKENHEILAMALQKASTLPMRKAIVQKMPRDFPIDLKEKIELFFSKIESEVESAQLKDEEVEKESDEFMAAVYLDKERNEKYEKERRVLVACVHNFYLKDKDGKSVSGSIAGEEEGPMNEARVDLEYEKFLDCFDRLDLRGDCKKDHKCVDEYEEKAKVKARVKKTNNVSSDVDVFKKTKSGVVPYIAGRERMEYFQEIVEFINGRLINKEGVVYDEFGVPAKVYIRVEALSQYMIILTFTDAVDGYVVSAELLNIDKTGFNEDGEERNQDLVMIFPDFMHFEILAKRIQGQIPTVVIKNHPEYGELRRELLPAALKEFGLITLKGKKATFDVVIQLLDKLSLVDLQAVITRQTSNA